MAAAGLALLLTVRAEATPIPDAAGVLPAHAPIAAKRAWAVRQSGLCLIATREVEFRLGLPGGTLGAISRVETGVVMPVTGDVEPWPWTVNAGGIGHWYATRNAAARATALMLAHSDADIDVGCMQVSMRYHRAAFASPAAALDPALNVAYGASLLQRLSGGRTGRALSAATGLYHSATPSLGNPYRASVARMQRRQRHTLADALASGP